MIRRVTVDEGQLREAQIIIAAARADYEAAKRTCQANKDRGDCRKPPYSKCTMPGSECPLDHFGHLEEVLNQ